MDKTLIFLDCDPGVDDAVALLLTCAAPEAELVGVSAVGGNVPLRQTLRNALDLVCFGGKRSVPVYAGAEGPLTGTALNAEEVHGADGLGGVPLPPSGKEPDGERAWDALHREALARPGELKLVLTGPPTDAAIAFSKYPDLPSLLREVVVMGGATTFGNTTPAAEFNFLADPEAAEALLQSGARVVLCPLDVTHRAYLSPRDLDALHALGSPQARFAAQVMGNTVEFNDRIYGVPGAAMHDPCAMVRALRPQLFQEYPCWAGVETGGTCCRGRLVTDAFSDAQNEPNCSLVLDVDRPAFVDAVLNWMSRY